MQTILTAILTCAAAWLVVDLALEMTRKHRIARFLVVLLTLATGAAFAYFLVDGLRTLIGFDDDDR